MKWESLRLAEIIIENSKSKIKVRDSSETGAYPFFTSGDKIKRLDESICEGENIFVATGGKANFKYFNGKASYSTDCYSIKTNEKVIVKYLYYFLVMNKEIINNKMFKGAALKHLQKKEFKDIKISIPAFEEQQRIVALLDTAFAVIDEAISKTLKKIKNNDDLFESILNETFQNPTFKYENLDNICKIVGGGTPNKKNKSFYDGTIPWATVRDLGYDNLNKTEHQITDNAVNQSSTNIIPSGNIVIATRVGLGKVCTLSQNTAINQDLKGIIPINNEKTDIGFLFFWFKSIRNVIINAGTGATVQGVRLDFIKSLKIPNLDLPLQKQIATKLSIISEKNKLLSSIYKEKINNLTKLKSNISKQEFEIGKSA